MLCCVVVDVVLLVVVVCVWCVSCVSCVLCLVLWCETLQNPRVWIQKRLRVYIQNVPVYAGTTIDEDMNDPHINTLVFCASIENVEQPVVIPNFLANIGKTFVMY